MKARNILFLSLILSASAFAADFDTKPVPVKTPPPIYPIELSRAGLSGLVAVKVSINENGEVVDCAVSKSSDPRFEAPAVAAVKNWKFKPASKAGAPVACSLLIPLKFSMEDA